MEMTKEYLVSAFLSMEPPQHIISLARKCGAAAGSISITQDVQHFIWSHCFNTTTTTTTTDVYQHEPYLKNVMKKLIRELESTDGYVLDEFYERYASYMVSVKEDGAAKGDSWVVKCISFLFNDGPKRICIPLRCSLNVLQGDTGCALWPSSLFLSEFILSHPEVFARKSCFEVGSGVGLVGICLQHAKASKVILTDGDTSTLANLKVNLEMNQIGGIDGNSFCAYDAVQCTHLPWESAKESELHQFMPDIVLGADVIYDPSCIPHLVRVLAILLRHERTVDSKSYPNPGGLVRSSTRIHNNNDDFVESDNATVQAASMKFLAQEMMSRPVALIASVIRNVNTFNCFLDTSRRANLVIRDLTDSIKFSNMIPYMESYKRSDVRLFMLSYLSD
ncbi:hypothetical protein vseg_009863 [Gypsophila vaccaria]